MIAYIFLGLTAAALVFFIVSLIEFIFARRRAKAGDITPHALKSKKIRMILSAAVAGVLLAVVVGFMLMVLMALAYM